jgi:hypothetical protein
MPISIRRITPQNEENESVAWLCDDSWRLPDQAAALETWLTDNHTFLKPADYIADIGFCPRDDARGGGAAISPDMMRMMANLGMSLFLSEYPGGDEVPEGNPLAD